MSAHIYEARGLLILYKWCPIPYHHDRDYETVRKSNYGPAKADADKERTHWQTHTMLVCPDSAATHQHGDNKEKSAAHFVGR